MMFLVCLFFICAISFDIAHGFEDVEVLEQRVKAIEDLLYSFEMRLLQQQEVLRSQSLTLSDLVEDKELKNARGNYPIAFAAYARSDIAYGNGDVIGFPEITTNNGFNYLAANSSFIVPYDGLYMFATTIYVETNHYINTRIMVDGIPTVHAWAADTWQPDQATNMVIGNFNVGDLVYVEAASSGDIEGLGGSDIVTSFTGALITYI